jgi:hypothetical protein
MPTRSEPGIVGLWPNLFPCYESECAGSRSPRAGCLRSAHCRREYDRARRTIPQGKDACGSRELLAPELLCLSATRISFAIPHSQYGVQP